MLQRIASSTLSPTQTPKTAPWRTALWIGLLVGISALVTASYACIAPFAAFATITATTLSRRQALGTMVAVWLANQAVGFGVLNYPKTAETVAWGLVIGAAAALATLATQWTVGHLGSCREPVRRLASFVAAFVLYQSTLYAGAVSLLGGTGAFAPKIIGEVLLINAVALIGLSGLHRLIWTAAHLTRRPRAREAAARFA